MSLQVVVGKGPIGTTVADQLAAAGERVRVISRRGGPSTERVEHVAVDASDPAALTAATRGAATLFNCASPPYDRWTRDWPALAAGMLAAVEATGAVYAVMGNLYGYGPVSGAMTEETPLAATDAKGRLRAQMWRDALALHEAGRVRAVEVRASDYYGPLVGAQGHFGDRSMPALLAGRPAQLLGNLDLPHSFTYVPDIARALIVAAATPATWGRAWHVPTAPAPTQREMATAIAAAAGAAPARVRRLPWPVLSAIGIAVPMLREVVKMRYQFDEPFVVDSSRSSEVLQLHATPLAEGIAATVHWWLDKSSREPQPVG